MATNASDAQPDEGPATSPAAPDRGARLHVCEGDASPKITTRRRANAAHRHFSSALPSSNRARTAASGPQRTQARRAMACSEIPTAERRGQNHQRDQGAEYGRTLAAAQAAQHASMPSGRAGAADRVRPGASFAAAVRQRAAMAIRPRCRRHGGEIGELRARAPGPGHARRAGVLRWSSVRSPPVSASAAINALRRPARARGLRPR